MKGKFVSGKAIEDFLKSLLYEGNPLSYYARLERLMALWKLGLISCDDARHYAKSINVKFGVQEPSGEVPFAEMLK